MRHGTQEELDAAKDDATKLPFGALFSTNNHSMFPDGTLVYRGCGGNEIDYVGSYEAVAFCYQDGHDYFYVDADDLEVIK